MNKKTSSIAALVIFVVIVLLFQQCTSTLQYSFGNNVNPIVQQSIQSYLNQLTFKDVGDVSLVLSFGNTDTTLQYISRQELSALAYDGFIVRTNVTNNKQLVVSVDGNSGTLASHVNNGVSYGCFTVLQELFGYGWGHPFRTTISPLAVEKEIDLIQTLQKNGRLPLNLAEKPHLLRRGIHIHSIHPLEMTHFLNGFANDMSLDYDKWKLGMKEWQQTCEWLVANRQNSVQWVILYADKWSQFADSTDRQKRLTEIVQVAKSWGISTGIDVPIVEEQQHAWRLIRKLGKYADEIQQLHNHIDYIVACGVDFMATELGFSEFTHGSGELMLAYLNESAVYLDQKYSLRMYAKVHISQGQYLKEYIDPLTGKPGLNFNFLPYYADKRLGIFPHTVQMFSLDDPVYSYGNTNFTQLKDFMFLEMGKREVIWHPETAYWVTFDVNVPLFLPTYIDRRLYDMRLIAKHSAQTGIRLDGQVFFSSGWEYGYWLNDIVTMRVAWNPHLEENDHEQALLKTLDDVTRSFVYDNNARKTFNQITMNVMNDQTKYLIKGQVNGTQPLNLFKRSGISLIEGWDTWGEINIIADKLLGMKMETQPTKLQYSEVEKGTDKHEYQNYIRPLLLEMYNSFNRSASQYLALSSNVNQNWMDLYSDITDSTVLISYRVKQVFELFEYAVAKHKSDKTQQELHKGLAKKTIQDAQLVVNHRLQNLRVRDPETIIGWNFNPTSYRFGYLWQSKHLYFWWRDYGRVIEGYSSPCFMNIMDPVDIAIGEGFGEKIAEALRKFLEHLWFLHGIADCLAGPGSEPTVPPFKI
jgi:hypothetical protein